MSRQELYFEVRVKQNDKIRSVFVPAKNHTQAAKKIRGGSILSVKKVPYEKIFSIGEFSPKFFEMDPNVWGPMDSRIFGLKKKDRREDRWSED